MTTDPTERTNLADQRPDKAAGLSARLAEQAAQMVAPLWPALIEGPVDVDHPLGVPRGTEDEFVYWAN